jgi:protease-4
LSVIGAVYRLVVSNLIGNLLIALANLVRWPRALRRTRWVTVEIKSPLPVRPPRKRWFGKPIQSLAGIDELFDKLADDDRLDGVVVRIRSVPGGWARVQSLHDVIARLRASGKRVVAHVSGGDLQQYYVACAASSIVIDESAPLGLHGISAEALFFANALDKAGVKAEVEYRGAYKSFAERFSRADMSPAQREAVDAILDRVESEVRGEIARSREVADETAADIVTGGPYTPSVAAERGIVDAVRYWDELPEWLGDAKLRLVSPEQWKKRRLRRFRWKPLFRRRAIRVISLHGSIVTGEGGGFPRRMLGSAAATRALDAARKDPRTAGVVLHIDSGGGSAQASDLMWRDVVRLGRKKPVIAYFEDMAASGGYYLACAAHEIVAQPLTLTGSIGVVAGKLDLSGLYEKLGIGSVVLTRGDAAAMNRASRGYSDEERRRLSVEIDALYEQFVRKVADGRELSYDEADAVAQGRVWTGADAHERKLVDELGDVSVAIDLAKRRARRKPTEKLRVVDARVTPRQGFMARVMGGSTAHLTLPDPLAELGDYLQLADERVLMMPSVTIHWD